MMAYFQGEQSAAELGRVLEAVLPGRSHAHDIARAVQASLGGRPVLASDRVLLLSARALAAVGDGAGAQAVLQATTRLADWAGRVDPAQLPPATTRLIEAGLLSATSSPVLGGGTVVRLDWGRLPGPAPALELLCLPLVHRLVEACLPLWQGTGGGGALLVAGLPDPSGTRWGDWLREAFRARLEWAVARCAWPQAPRLVFAT